MGLGPNGSSLLHKLNQRRAHEMPFVELCSLIEAEQKRRTLQRAMGRVKRIMKDSGSASYKPKERTLEQLGIAPAMCERLRAGGKSDSQLIQIMRKQGLI